MITLSSHGLVVLTSRLISVGALISCGEYLVFRDPLRDSGLMSWPVSRLRFRFTAIGAVARLLDSVFSWPAVLWYLGLRALLAAFTLSAPESLVAQAWLLLLQGVLACLFMLRSRYGHDGADQFLSIAYISLGIACLVRTPRAEWACLWFLTLQLCLSYFVAGAAKVSAAGWRDGTYLTGISGLDIYGNQRAASLLRSRPGLARWISRFMLLWELTFPLVLVLPPVPATCLFAGGLVFHVLNAGLMGLNSFLWSFPALYPAALYCVRARWA
jgi:hypothetical protein